jgi:hypothetical protein
MAEQHVVRIVHFPYYPHFNKEFTYKYRESAVVT